MCTCCNKFLKLVWVLIKLEYIFYFEKKNIFRELGLHLSLKWTRFQIWSFSGPITDRINGGRRRGDVAIPYIHIYKVWRSETALLWTQLILIRRVNLEKKKSSSLYIDLIQILNADLISE